MWIAKTYVGEVVLGQHGVSRISTVIIVEDDMLQLFTALDNFSGASLELVANLANQRDDKGSHDGKDKLAQLLLKLFHHLGQDGDLVDGGVNSLHDVVVKLDGGHDLSIDVLDVQSEFLGVPGRDGSILHLSSIGIFLNFINLLLFFAAAEDTVGNLVKEFAKETSIGLLALLKCTFELLNLVLGQLVRYWKDGLVNGALILLIEISKRAFACNRV